MNTKYYSFMLALIAGLLTVIAACLLFQVVNSISPFTPKDTLPVLVKGFDIGDETVPVNIKGSGASYVTIVGVEIPKRSRLQGSAIFQTELPVSLDAVNGGSIGAYPVPVEISK